MSKLTIDIVTLAYYTMLSNKQRKAEMQTEKWTQLTKEELKAKRKSLLKYIEILKADDIKEIYKID